MLHECVDETLIPGLKSLYERTTKVRLSVDYETLMLMFRDPDLSIADIARRTGVTSQHISATYRRYFSPALGRIFLPAQHRKKIDPLPTMRAHFAELESSKRIVRLVALIQEAGLKVEPVPVLKRGAYVPRLSILQVEQSLCSFHHARGLYRRRGQSYYRWHFTLTDEKLDAHLFWVTDVSPMHKDRIFVLPDDVLRTMTVPGKEKSICAPVGLAARAKSAFWDYENAWHVLRPPVV